MAWESLSDGDGANELIRRLKAIDIEVYGSLYAHTGMFSGDLYSSTWDGEIPADLTYLDTTATTGFYLDSSSGSGQFSHNLYISGSVAVGSLQNDYLWLSGSVGAAYWVADFVLPLEEPTVHAKITQDYGGNTGEVYPATSWHKLKISGALWDYVHTSSPWILLSSYNYADGSIKFGTTGITLATIDTGGLNVAGGVDLSGSLVVDSNTTLTGPLLADLDLGGNKIEDARWVRLTATSDASLTSTLHAFQVGDNTGQNLIMDANEIMARDNGSAAGLGLNLGGGEITLGGDLAMGDNKINNAKWLRLTAIADASLTSTLHAFQIGDSTSQNLVMDPNEVISRNNGATSPLMLNANGGDIELHSNQSPGDNDLITWAGKEIAPKGTLITMGYDEDVTATTITTTNASVHSVTIACDYANQPLFVQASMRSRMAGNFPQNAWVKLTIGQDGTVVGSRQAAQEEVIDITVTADQATHRHDNGGYEVSGTPVTGLSAYTDPAIVVTSSVDSDGLMISDTLMFSTTANASGDLVLNAMMSVNSGTHTPDHIEITYAIWRG